MYYECLELAIEGKRDEIPPFVIDVYDVDKNFLKSDSYDYMCRCVIPLQEASYTYLKEKSDDHGKSPEPKWHKCYYKQGSAPSGEILVAFVIAE